MSGTAEHPAPGEWVQDELPGEWLTAFTHHVCPCTGTPPCWVCAPADSTP